VGEALLERPALGRALVVVALRHHRHPPREVGGVVGELLRHQGLLDDAEDHAAQVRGHREPEAQPHRRGRLADVTLRPVLVSVVVRVALREEHHRAGLLELRRPGRRSVVGRELRQRVARRVEGEMPVARRSRGADAGDGLGRAASARGPRDRPDRDAVAGPAREVLGRDLVAADVDAGLDAPGLDPVVDRQLARPVHQEHQATPIREARIVGRALREHDLVGPHAAGVGDHVALLVDVDPGLVLLEERVGRALRSMGSRWWWATTGDQREQTAEEPRPRDDTRPGEHSKHREHHEAQMHSPCRRQAASIAQRVGPWRDHLFTERGGPPAAAPVEQSPDVEVGS
jgi:hypothetical protein